MSTLRAHTLASVLCLFGTSCIPSWVVRPATRDGMRPVLQEGVEGFISERDVTVAEGALLSNLKLIEGVSGAYPDDRGYLVMAALARGNYAFAFIQDEVEAVKLAYPDDTDRVAALKARAVINFETGETFAHRALLLNDDLAELLAGRRLIDLSDPELETALALIEPDDLGALFWYTFNWGAKLQADLDIQQATAMPKLERLIEKILEMDETYFHGIGPHLLAGTFYGFRSPALGGSPEKAAKHFDEAKRLGGGMLMPDVLKAQFVFAQTEKQAEFESTLKHVISSTIADDYALLDTIAQRKACRLYANLDQFFLDDPKPPPARCQELPHKYPLREAE